MKAAITFDSLSKRDKMRVIEAAKKVYLETQEAQIKWMWAITLWTLHESEGYGAKRLNRFLDTLEEAFEYDADGSSSIPAMPKRARRQCLTAIFARCGLSGWASMSMKYISGLREKIKNHKGDYHGKL